MDLAKIDALLRNIQFDCFYLEATFQFKLLMQLAKIYDEDRIFPERNIEYYHLNSQDFSKKEADIIIEQPNNLPAVIELKMPMNGQVPEQMYKFIEDRACCKTRLVLQQALAVFRPTGCKTAFLLVVVAKLKFCNNLDIKFLEELKASGKFFQCYLITVTNNSNFWQGNKNDGIYAPFRNGSPLKGKIYKPTGSEKNKDFHQISGEYHITWNTLANNFRYFAVEV